MAAQVVVVPIVKWIFSTALGGIFGSRGGGSGVFSDFFRSLPERGTLRSIPTTPPLNPTAPLPNVPGMPGTVSIPDRIPPSTVAGTVARSILRGGWVGALFYPTATSSRDTVCIETQYGPWCPPGMPATASPVAVPGNRPGTRRRPRAVPGTSPRRRERPRTAAPPALPAPRGRPVTISRPQVIPAPRVLTSSFPTPRSLPPPGASFPLPRTSSIPATIPAAATFPWSRVLPTVAQLVLPSLGSYVRTSFASPALSQPIPNVGTMPLVSPLPSSFPSSQSQPSALPQLALAPLTSFRTAEAQSPAQDLDRQCRERAKRKRKKRKPRRECWKGSYTETSKGTLKRRREKIKCR